jgi:hypothetical protein
MTARTAAALSLCLATGALLAQQAPATAAPEAELAKLAWLAGCWKSAGGEPGSEEQWMPAAGGTMMGMGRTVKQGRTVSHEFMQIRAGEGTLAFVAHPSGQKSAAFPLLRISDDEVVFENAQHDFPQRVAYRREGDARLAARIEGMRNGALRVIPFPMERVSCDVRAGSAK